MGKIFEDVESMQTRQLVFHKIKESLDIVERLPDVVAFKGLSKNILHLLKVKIGGDSIAKLRLTFKEELQSITNYNLFLDYGKSQDQHQRMTPEERVLYDNLSATDRIILEKIQNICEIIDNNQFLKNDFFRIENTECLIKFVKYESLNHLEQLHEYWGRIPSLPDSDELLLSADLAMNFLEIFSGKPVDSETRQKGRSLYTNEWGERQLCKEGLSLCSPQVQQGVQEILFLVENNKVLQEVLFGRAASK